MGYEILYCAGCQAQLRGPDFESGVAFRAEGLSYCGKCAPEEVKNRPRELSTNTPRRGTPATTRVKRSPDTGRTTRRSHTRKGSTGLVVGIVLGTALGVGLVFLIAAGTGGTGDPEPPPEPGTVAPDRAAAAPNPPPPKDPVPPTEEQAKRELDELIKSARLAAGDKDGRVRKLEEFIRRYPDTFAAATAQAKLRELTAPPPKPASPAGTPLLNGKDLEGWRIVLGPPQYEKGALVMRGNEEIMRPLPAADFELTGNLYLQITDLEQGGLGFRRANERRGTGGRLSFYADGDVHYRDKGNEIMARGKPETVKLNQWQAFRLAVRKETVTLEIEGRVVLSSRTAHRGPGFLAIYANELKTGQVRYKNLVLKP